MKNGKLIMENEEILVRGSQLTMENVYFNKKNKKILHPASCIPHFYYLCSNKSHRTIHKTL